MKSRSPIDVTAAVVARNGRILLARRPPGDRLEGKWEFPGGKIDPGESAETCLQRELFEEFGSRSSIGHFLGESVHRYDHLTVRLLVFEANLIDDRIHLNAHSEFRWVPLVGLTEFELAPADIPVAQNLVEGRWPLASGEARPATKRKEGPGS
ncbi:MAG: (deoxy)nucleoside triphosphate pyrophosphohydrolase [Desulfobacterales bacterium]